MGSFESDIAETRVFVRAHSVDARATARGTVFVPFTVTLVHVDESVLVFVAVFVGNTAVQLTVTQPFSKTVHSETFVVPYHGHFAVVVLTTLLRTVSGIHQLSQIDHLPRVTSAHDGLPVRHPAEETDVSVRVGVLVEAVLLPKLIDVVTL